LVGWGRKFVGGEIYSPGERRERVGVNGLATKNSREVKGGGSLSCRKKKKGQVTTKNGKRGVKRVWNRKSGTLESKGEVQGYLCG